MSTEHEHVDPTVAHPSDIAAEAAILACCFSSQEACDYAMSTVRSEDFAAPPALAVWEAIKVVTATGRRPDVVSVSSALRVGARLDLVGGVEGLTALTSAEHDPGNVDAYCATVRWCAKRRAVIAECRCVEAEAAGKMDGVDVDAWASGAAERVARVADDSGDDGITTGVDACNAVAEKWKNPDRRPALKTGLTELDRLMRGMRGAQLIIVAANSGVGKTAFVMSTALNVLSEPEYMGLPAGVLTFSLEMSGSELAERCACTLSNVDSNKLDPEYKGPPLTPEEGQRFAGSLATLAVPRWVIDDRGEITMPQIRAKARRVQAWLARRNEPLRLIVIDYAQLVSPDRESRRKDGNREQEIAAVGRAAKRLAKELDVPVILCAQLNEDANKEGRKPRGRDLRESKALLHDADKVLLLWNPAAQERALAVANSTPAAPNGDDHDVMDLILDKHRGGRTGTVRVCYWPQYTKFSDADADDLRRAEEADQARQQQQQQRPQQRGRSH